MYFLQRISSRIKQAVKKGGNEILQMNNQSKLARQIIYAIGTEDEISLKKVYPLYHRYLRRIGKENIDEPLLIKVNGYYTGFMLNKYVNKKEDWFTWDKNDARDLEGAIKRDLLE